MIKQRKDARSTGGTAERAAETAAFGRAAVPCKDSTTAAEVRQIQISELLPAGERNAVPLRHLVQLTGMNSRDLRRQIETERRRGLPICANNRTGYFIAENDEERRRFVQSMRSRAKEIETTAAAIEQAEV